MSKLKTEKPRTLSAESMMGFHTLGCNSYFRILCIQLLLITHFGFTRKKRLLIHKFQCFLNQGSMQTKTDNIYSILPLIMLKEFVCRTYLTPFGNSIRTININIAYIKLAKQNNGGNNMCA